MLIAEQAKGTTRVDQADGDDNVCHGIRSNVHIQSFLSVAIGNSALLQLCAYEITAPNICGHQTANFLVSLPSIVN